MSGNELRQLFRPFAQGSAEIARRYGGAGLGLSFVKRFAKAIGGDLKVTSRRGAGSTFRLTARVEPADSHPASERTQAPPLPARPLSILCAEDNPYGRVVMNTILRELGHRVDFVETGEAAIEAVTSGTYDAVLMDVTLSGLGGTRSHQTDPFAAGQSRADAGGRNFRPRREKRCTSRAHGRRQLLFRKASQSGQIGAGARKSRSLNTYALVTPLARSTIRTTSDMMRFSSKSFGV